MATETVKRCDVFRTIGDDVVTVRVRIEDPPSDANPDETICYYGKQVDLCPRAIERLKRIVERGTTPPK